MKDWALQMHFTSSPHSWGMALVAQSCYTHAHSVRLSQLSLSTRGIALKKRLGTHSTLGKVRQALGGSASCQSCQGQGNSSQLHFQVGKVLIEAVFEEQAAMSE